MKPQKVTACPLVICPERLRFYSLSEHCQACAARVQRARERLARAERRDLTPPARRTDGSIDEYLA